MSDAPTYPVTVIDGESTRVIDVPAGGNLRRALLAAGISPYGKVSRRANCGGKGLCATCGVWIESGVPAPTHWHDVAAGFFGYPRLSCQIKVDGPMTIRLVPGKVMWGGPDPARRYRKR
jgi:ferredoxin